MNEGKRTAFEQWKAVQMGIHQSAGWPDLVIIYQGRHLAIELKTLKGTATASQKGWIQTLQANGWEAHICKGFEATMAVIDAFFDKA
jgi:hypothetical protein